MTETDAVADNAVRCDGNRASDSNGPGNGNRVGDSNGASDGNGTSDSNGMGNSNRVGNSVADNAMADSDGNIRVGSSAVVGDLGHLCHT